MAAIAWLLNLGAELELAAPRSYRPTPALEARIRELRAQLTTLLAQDDRIIGFDADCAHTDLALAFCPTPSALRRIVEAGLTPPAAPSLAVLTRVNGRGFSAELGQTLPGARYVRSMDALEDVIADRSPSGAWLLKRDFSFASRERRRVDAHGLDASTAGFARRSFARGEGMQVEPLVARSEDFAQHGYVLANATVAIGAAMVQVCDARGVWQHSRPCGAGELAPNESDALAREVERVGKALAGAGYHGPYGVDAFRYHDAHGARCFQPRSEINARFSMGYPRALLERCLAATR